MNFIRFLTISSVSLICSYIIYMYHRYQVTHQQLEDERMYTKAGLWILEFYLAQKYLRYKVKVHKVKGEQLAHKCPCTQLAHNSHRSELLGLAKEFEMKDIEHLFDESFMKQNKNTKREA